MRSHAGAVLRALLPALLLLAPSASLAAAPSPPSKREKVVGLVSRAVGEQAGADSAALVQESYRKAGVKLSLLTPRMREVPAATLWRTVVRKKALKHRAPRPGDMVFFRDTVDANGDGKLNDGPTHVGVVERVAQDGTVTFVHRATSGTVVRSRLNLAEPSRRFDWQGGRMLNDVLRGEKQGMPAGLSGELFAGFGAASVLTGELKPGATSVARKDKGKAKKPTPRLSQREKREPKG